MSVKYKLFEHYKIWTRRLSALFLVLTQLSLFLLVTNQIFLKYTSSWRNSFILIDFSVWLSIFSIISFYLLKTFRNGSENMIWHLGVNALRYFLNYKNCWLTSKNRFWNNISSEILAAYSPISNEQHGGVFFLLLFPSERQFNNIVSLFH